MGLIMKNGIQYPGVGSGEGSGLEISQLDDIKITAPLKDGDELIYDKEKGKWINTTKYHKYSTDEQIIGEWIDGKPLYRKVITTQMPQVTTSNSPVTKSIEHNIVNAMFKKIELYCIDGPTETLKDLKKVLKDWDLADFIKIISITAKEVSKYSYQLTLADGKLTLCNSTQQLFSFD